MPLCFGPWPTSRPTSATRSAAPAWPSCGRRSRPTPNRCTPFHWTDPPHACLSFAARYCPLDGRRTRHACCDAKDARLVTACNSNAEKGMDWTGYRSSTWDELIDAQGVPRPAAQQLVKYQAGLSRTELGERQVAADVTSRVMGITFTVYSEGRNVDRTLPFDLIPRVIERREWERTAAGLRQRMRALNLFIGDVYGEQRIVKDKVFPAELLADSANFRPQCVGVKPPLGVWAHICGSDLVRDGDGTLYALEDNLRIPSGVSYMIENRAVAKKVFPELFDTCAILPVDDYPAQLYDTL